LNLMDPSQFQILKYVFLYNQSSSPFAVFGTVQFYEETSTH